MSRFSMVFIFMGLAACAHSGGVGSGTGNSNAPETLGYLQFKTLYADAAWNEGKMGGVKKALDNKHSKTGKPYPCWNALKPFHGKNLPVSLKLANADDPKLKSIVSLGQMPVDKLDSSGKDGVFSTDVPAPKSGFSIWKMDQVYQKANRAISKPVIGLVDVSESMKAGAKFRTLVGLKDSSIQFQKIYLFSEPGSMTEVVLADVARQTPKGGTAIYDNLKNLLSQYPGSEFVVITDGKDNKSRSNLEEVRAMASQSGSVINIVLTGKRTDDKVNGLAHRTGGQVMHDTLETGDVMQPSLDVSWVR